MNLGVTLPTEMTPRQHCRWLFLSPPTTPITSGHTNVWFRILPTLVPIMTGGRFTRAREAAARALAKANASVAVAAATHDPTASATAAPSVAEQKAVPPNAPPPKKSCSAKCDNRTPPCWGRGVQFVCP